MGKVKQYKTIGETDACYFAGYFDGEGCINIHWRIRGEKPHGSFDLKIAISCTFESIVRLMAVVLGGATQEHKWKVARIGKARQWIWQASNREAAHILRALLPYLTVKRDEAELAIRFQEHIGNNVSVMHSRDMATRESLRAERLQMAGGLKQLRENKMQYVSQTESIQ